MLFDARNTLTRLQALSFDGDDYTSNYWDDGADGVTCSWVDSLDGFPRMRLAIVRRRGLPQLESDGNLSPLQIPPTAGLAEQIHLVFFPDNIIGSEFNFYGPRATRIGPYLRAKGLVNRITVQPVLRDDASRAFGELNTLRLLRLRIHRSYLPTILDADETLGALFASAMDLGQVEEAEVVFRVSRSPTASLGSRLLDMARRLVQRDGGVVRPNSGVSAFEVRGRSERSHRIETIDLLSDRFVIRKRVVLEDGRHRVLLSGSAYSAITDAYQEVKDDLPRLDSLIIE